MTDSAVPQLEHQLTLLTFVVFTHPFAFLLCSLLKLLGEIQRDVHAYGYLFATLGLHVQEVIGALHALRPARHYPVAFLF